MTSARVVLRHAVLAAIFAAASAAASAQAVVYRWADDRGAVHYGDKPPTDRPSVKLPAVPKAPGPAEIIASGESVDALAQRRKDCADARQQLAYLDSRAVTKPLDEPNRLQSRELDSNYQANLAAYERFEATRRAHLGRIAENCDG